jgi:hypothetical protein
MRQTPAAKLSLLVVVKSQFADVSLLLRAANQDAIHLQRKAVVDCFLSCSQCLRVAIAAVTRHSRKIQLVVVSPQLRDAKTHVMQLQVLSVAVFSRNFSQLAATRAVMLVMPVKKLANQLAVVRSQLAVVNQQHL